MERLTPTSMNPSPASDDLEQLALLFPEAVSEGKVDFHILRQLLGDAVDDGEEKFGLNWHGKRAARRLALTPSAATLRPSVEDSVNWDTTRNLMIEGGDYIRNDTTLPLPCVMYPL